MLAAIPYTTFPTIELGPLNLRTFGLMVALGVLLGAWIAARYAERFGLDRDDTYRVATWMVLAGIIGSRLTWVATHTDQIDSPVDVIAIWEGGIQFSGGFIFALAVGMPFFRRWPRVMRWQVLDGFALGLSVGLAMGRVGCYSVGEHFGRTTDFFLATRYDGGDVREPSLGDAVLVPGTTFHNTSLYEFIYMMLLFAGLGALVLWAHRKGREVVPGTLVGVFVLVYGVARFASDSLRVNDERVAGMTGAQWMSLAMVPAGIWILWKVRPKLAILAASAATEATEATEATDESTEGAEGESGEASASADVDGESGEKAERAEGEGADGGSGGAPEGEDEGEDAAAGTVDASGAGEDPTPVAGSGDDEPEAEASGADGEADAGEVPTGAGSDTEGGEPTGDDDGDAGSDEVEEATVPHAEG